MPHHLPEATKSRRTHASPAPRSHCLKPFQMRFSQASPALHRSPGPFALRSLVPDSGRVRWETREAPGRSQCCPHGVRTRRAATCSTKPGVCASAGYSRETLSSPRLGMPQNLQRCASPQVPVLTVLRQPRRLAPLRPPARGDLLPCLPTSSPDPSAGGQGPYHSRPLQEDRAPKYLPRRCRERRESCRSWYPSARCRARRGRRESLPGLTERTGRGRFLLCPAGCGGNRVSRAARVARGEARRSRRGSVNCVSSGARRASAPSQPPEPGAAPAAAPVSAKLLPPGPHGDN